VDSNKNRLTTNADLNETSLEQAVIDIAAFVDERGLLIAARPRKLIIPPALMFVATRVLQSESKSWNSR
jgi:phage major head subunit gpT-like protein